MNYYIPSNNKRSRMAFKRRGRKKQLWFLIVILSIALFYALTGFDFKFSREVRVSGLKSGKALLLDKTESLEQGPVPEADPEKTTLNAEEIDEPVSLIEEKTVPISTGDTLMGLLVQEGLGRGEAHSVISSLQDVFNPRRLHQNHEITLAFETMEEDDPKFQSLNLKLDETREVQVARCPENGFVAREIRYELSSRLVRAESEITSSLYKAAVDAGIPLEILMQMIRAFSFDVDFQRDILPHDRFEVLFEELIDANGNFIRGGAVLYASLNTRGRNLPIYRYETSDGEVDFFNEKGQSVRKTLMVTPIDGARLTSGYGKRRHPILGFSRMHQGLDFAAPIGTPIMAAGDGIVEYAGRKGNYGNYIRLRHPNEYHTVYAHLSRFARGIRPGIRVKQGQTIGYVGSTGLSTGPHLHYEVHHRGSPVNPARVNTPPGRILDGEDLKRFMAAKKDLEILFASVEKREELASLD